MNISDELKEKDITEDLALSAGVITLLILLMLVFDLGYFLGVKA